MDEPGRIIGGRFVLDTLAGRGGMATVWKAQCVHTRRTVALKRVLPALARSEAVRAMFADEGAILATLAHRHVVGLVERGESGLGGAWMALEWIDGVTARHWLTAPVHGGRGAPLNVAARVGLDLLEALGALHTGRAGRHRVEPVIHRDVAPANVMVGADGVARLIDFGLARSLARARATQRGTAKGKPGYLPPEVLAGGLHGARGDLYALGVVLWEMLAGRRIFIELPDAAARARALLTARRPSLARVRPDLPAAVVAVVDRALALDPAARWASAEAMHDALASAVGIALRRPVVEAVGLARRAQRAAGEGAVGLAAGSAGDALARAVMLA